MTFQLPGVESWSFQIVIDGSLLILEARHRDMCCSSLLNPLDSPRRLAHQLINRPQCALHSRGGAA